MSNRGRKFALRNFINRVTEAIVLILLSIFSYRKQKSMGSKACCFGFLNNKSGKIRVSAICDLKNGSNIEALIFPKFY